MRILSAKWLGTVALAVAFSVDAPALAQEPAAPQHASIESAIDKLGVLDYAARTAASRAVRRTAGAEAVPSLLRAVEQHDDGYVRYRALVLLTGFNDPRTTPAMLSALTSPNDRLRAVAYGFFEKVSAPGVNARLMSALDTETSQFVRPSLVRALVARATTAQERAAIAREATRGEDFFRSAVIEALGDYKASYAVDTIIDVVRLDGPLSDDAALALGKIGDQKALPVLAELRTTAPRRQQASIAAALCLLGSGCDTEEKFLADTLEYAAGNPQEQDLYRATTASLAALGVAGRPSAVAILAKAAESDRDAVRAPAALALATIALRNTPLMLGALGGPSAAETISLLVEGFEMLDEDLDKERFFATVRRTYWEAPDGSPRRDLMRTLIEKLDF